MPSGLQSNGQWLCKPCNTLFHTREMLMQHKQQMRLSGAPKHIHCKHCGQDFKTGIAEVHHIQQFHPQGQNLECPGCGFGPFARAAGLISHIEKGRCSRLSMADLDARREKKTEFARKLEALTHEPVKNNFVKYMGRRAASTGSWGEEGQGPADTASLVRPEPDSRAAAVRSGREYLSPRRDGAWSERPGREGVVDWSINSGPAVADWGNSKSEAVTDWKTERDSHVADWSTSKSPGGKVVRDWDIEPDSAAADWSIESPDGEAVTDWNIKADWNTKANWNMERDSSVADWGIKQGPSRPANVADRVDSADGSIEDPWDQGRVDGSDGVADWGSKEDPAAAVWDVGEDAADAAQEQQPRRAAASEQTPFDSRHPDHPDNACFYTGNYYCIYSERFICPQAFCGKAFKAATGLVGHLRSSAHGNKRYTCPSCHRVFKSLTAITSHAEQSSSRCRAREARDYDAFIDQLTAGIVEVSMDRHHDGTVKYETWKGALGGFGGKKAGKMVDAEFASPATQRW